MTCVIGTYSVSSSIIKGEKERIVPGYKCWMVGIMEVLILFSLKWEAKLSAEPRVGDDDKLEV